jgi:hypothetical protein
MLEEVQDLKQGWSQVMAETPEHRSCLGPALSWQQEAKDQPLCSQDSQ